MKLSLSSTMLTSLISWYVTLIVKYVEEDGHQNESQRRLIKTEPYLDMKKISE